MLYLIAFVAPEIDQSEKTCHKIRREYYPREDKDRYAVTVGRKLIKVVGIGELGRQTVPHEIPYISEAVYDSRESRHPCVSRLHARTLGIEEPEVGNSHQRNDKMEHESLISVEPFVPVIGTEDT